MPHKECRQGGKIEIDRKELCPSQRVHPVIDHKRKDKIKKMPPGFMVFGDDTFDLIIIPL